MASDLEIRAKEAFIDDHFELAVDLYTQAIAMTPKNAELFADRAQANIKLNYFTEAVVDANKAIELDPSMSKAYLRKGLACMKLEEYQTAKAALETGASLAPAESRFTKLIKECDERIAEEAGELPNQSVDKTLGNVVAPPASESLGNVAVAPKDAQPTVNLSYQGSAARPKYRHGFYQKPEEVVVTIFAKGIPAKNVVVDFGEPLHWTSLEYTRESAIVQRPNVSSDAPRPSYPSSKLRHVDWDKLEAEVKKEEKDEKLDGDAALNKFFRDIYKDADEDTRRAMMKSFVESNGTVLSTNWKEVGAKKVEGSPPDGMELKKWEI
uniref:Suppressor of G2 allele of SKP1 n=1 Tax=Nicotiana gossei TaxID=118698 RepID=A0A224AST8_9SOLA|nr:suppressor of G2 allele of SKP1 [Nicotiana gossei]